MAEGPLGEDAPRRRGVIGGLVGRVAPTVMRQIDMDALVEMLDVNAIAAQLDLDALMTRLDMDALVDQLDVNAIAEKLDLDALMTRLDMAQLTAGATQDVANSGLDLIRRQLLRVDATIESTADRLVRRSDAARPVAPRQLAPTTDQVVAAGSVDDQLRRRDVSGHYAGPATRLLALTGDTFGALTTYGFFGSLTLYFLTLLSGADLTIGSGGWLSRILVVVWMLVWFWVPVGLFSRTPAMALAGLAVVRRDGSLIDGRRALVRAVVLPFSLVFFGLGFIGGVIGRERRTLHDVAAGTVVVYDWGTRQAEQPVSIREQLSARVSRRREQAQTEVGMPAPGDR